MPLSPSAQFINSNTIQVTWTPVNGDNDYQIRYLVNGVEQTVSQPPSPPNFTPDGKSTFTFTVADNYDPNKTYSVRVKATDTELPEESCNPAPPPIGGGGTGGVGS